MALTTCPDCKAEVSDQATACVKCGRPITTPEREAKKEASQQAVGQLITVLIVLVGLWWLVGKMTSCGQGCASRLAFTHYERCAAWCKVCQRKWMNHENCAAHMLGADDHSDGTGESCADYYCPD
jgi:hypothetical protein